MNKDFQAWMLGLNRAVREVKNTVVRLFEAKCECRMFTTKLHLFDHLCNDLQNFGSIQSLDAARYEHFSFVLKRAHRRTSMRRVAEM